MNILPGRPLRKQVRAASTGWNAVNGVVGQTGPASWFRRSTSPLIFCFAALSGQLGTRQGESLTAPGPPHDSLQMPVKNEDSVFQSHRQIHTVV